MRLADLASTSAAVAATPPAPARSRCWPPARVVRHRPDKPATQADTITTVRAIHAGAYGGG